MADPSKSAPPPPAFPSRLGNNAGIWEAVVNDEDEEESLEDAQPVEDESDDGEFMNEEFRADLAKLEVRTHDGLWNAGIQKDYKRELGEPKIETQISDLYPCKTTRIIGTNKPHD